MSELIKKKCVPCTDKTRPFTEGDTKPYLKELPGWEFNKKQIEKTFKFKDFLSAIDFVNRVSQIAEEEGHHPDLQIHYNLVKCECWTHESGGVTENDLILAAKINKAAQA